MRCFLVPKVSRLQQPQEEFSSISSSVKDNRACLITLPYIVLCLIATKPECLNFFYKKIEQNKKTRHTRSVLAVIQFLFCLLDVYFVARILLWLKNESFTKDLSDVRPRKGLYNLY